MGLPQGHFKPQSEQLFVPLEAHKIELGEAICSAAGLATAVSAALHQGIGRGA